MTGPVQVIHGPDLPRPPGMERAIVIFGPEVKTPDQVAALLTNYPDARGARPQQSLGAPPGVIARFDTPGGTGLPVLWPKRSDGSDPLPPAYAPDAESRLTPRWLRPGVGAGDALPIPLMTWWVILYGLSMFARYHPLEWLRALDLNASSEAVPIEVILAEALEAVPTLVAEAVGLW